MCFGLFVSGTACAQDVVKLPPPDVMGGLPLMQAMNERKTDRVFSSEPLDNQTLSDILWAAFSPVAYSRAFRRLRLEKIR